jgi:S-adenosylmethionine decarboxylase proenzyme
MGQQRSVDDDENKFVVRVSQRFILLSFCVSCLVAFSVGHISRIFLIVNPNNEFLQIYREELKIVGVATEDHFNLPDPVLQIGKTPPITTYTSKNFDTAKSTTTYSRWMVTEVGEQLKVGDVTDEKNCDADVSEREECRSSTPSSTSTNTNGNKNNESSDDNEDDEEEEEHLPAGQHLLVDIENVDSMFLNSEERLAHAMLKLIDECGLTLLSYHCHKMVPMGVSCAGVLLESHVSFHTWPTEGVITIDLFTCGSNSLFPIVPLVEMLFAVPTKIKSTDVNKPAQPKMVWAHKYRGFDHGESSAMEITDMLRSPVGQMSDYKKEVCFWIGVVYLCARVCVCVCVYARRMKI